MGFVYTLFILMIILYDYRCFYPNLSRPFFVFLRAFPRHDVLENQKICSFRFSFSIEKVFHRIFSLVNSLFSDEECRFDELAFLPSRAQPGRTTRKKPQFDDREVGEKRENGITHHGSFLPHACLRGKREDNAHGRPPGNNAMSLRQTFRIQKGKERFA